MDYVILFNRQKAGKTLMKKAAHGGMSRPL
jgi:hypothetical protein